MGTSLQGGRPLFAKGCAAMQVSMLVGIGAALLFGIAEVANWRRNNRRDVDKVGFMPWRGIALASAMVALLATALWLHQS